MIMGEQNDQLRRQLEISKQADEDYVKHIFLTKLKKGSVKIKDISEATGRNHSSVRAAVNKLTERGYVQSGNARGGDIELTAEGRALAEQVVARHNMIKEWLTKLGIDQEESEEQACQMEHVISDNVLKAIRRHVNMAVTLLGNDSAYPEKMKKMARAMYESMPSGAGEHSSLMQDDKIAGFFEKYGGMDNIKELLDFCDERGGIEALRSMSSFVDLLGGQDELEKAQAQIAQKRSESRLADAVALIAEEGSASQLRLYARQIESLGGQAKVKRLLRQVEAAGGIDILLELTEQTLSLRKTFEKIGGKAPVSEES